ncbi:hypothetical protein [Treponema sp.]|uniref:hypothetical protein n=1 Tax=Treponema sp. TaxID=166 RepID=UPI003890B7B5
MSILKKIVIALSAATVLLLSGCKVTETEEIRISELSANIDNAYFKQKAVAKVSNDTGAGQDSKISQIFSANGTMIYARNAATNEQLIVTYRGMKAGTYKTGTVNTDTLVNKMLSFLVTESPSVSVSDLASADANVTYVEGNGDRWYSTLCTIRINGQENGVKLSLINGSFDCDVYKSASEKKHISGTISNVIGIK